MTTKLAESHKKIEFSYQHTLQRLLKLNFNGRVPMENSSMSNPDNITALVNIWHDRLRNFRSTDSFDAVALVATDSGRQVMSKAINLYLGDWINSDWVDAPEIEMLAIELARLWPRDAEKPQLDLDMSGNNAIVILDVFNNSFSAHQNDDGMRLNEDFKEYVKLQA